MQWPMLADTVNLILSRAMRGGGSEGFDKLDRCDMHWPLDDCAAVSPRWQETSATQDEAHKPPNKTTTSPKQPTAHPAQHTTTSDNIASNREYDIHL